MNVLVIFSYGSLTTIDDVAGFYQDIYHGTATESDIARGFRTYDSFGKADPLGANTSRVGKALVKKLETATNEAWEMHIANKHSNPTIEQVAEKCTTIKPKRIVTLSLTPFESLTGSSAYEKKFSKFLGEYKLSSELIHISPFAEKDSFIEVLADRVITARNWLPEQVRPNAEIVFTAHSMPGLPKAHQKMISQYEALAEKVAIAAQVEKHHLAYRSGRPLPERWLGPDVLDVIDDLSERGVTAIIFVEALSTIENLEAIEEITIETISRAKKLGIEAVQSEFLNDSIDFVEMLADHVVSEIR